MFKNVQKMLKEETSRQGNMSVILTLWFLLDRWDLLKSNAVPLTHTNSNIVVNILNLTLSKVFTDQKNIYDFIGEMNTCL